MLKKLLIAMVCLCCSSMYAQNKFGYVNVEELSEAMPERAKAEATLKELSDKYQADVSKLQEEMNKKYEDYVLQKDSLPSAMLKNKEAELQSLQQRLENYQQLAYQDLQKKQTELITPITEKIYKAIDEVGKENKFTAIFPAITLLYRSETELTDVMPLVKAKLGLPLNAPKATATPQKSTTTKK